jgi:hypothetical protein
LLAGAESPTLGRIQEGFDGRFFWMNNAPERNDGINGFLPQPPSLADVPPDSWQKIGLAAVEARPRDRVPTDDWPFLYLLDPTVPALNLRGIFVMAVCALAVLYWFAPPRRAGLNWRMFFIGAGFMLLETKGVVHLALLFGSTWMVNSIVFFAILVMILLSNLYVLLVRPAHVWPYYLLVAASLITGILIPIDAFLSLQGPARVLASCAVVFVPVFFAGIVFATTFRDSVEPDIDLGSNIAGAMAGGLSEPLSLMIGFSNLLVIALILYGCSWVLGRRGSVAVPSPTG